MDKNGWFQKHAYQNEGVSTFPDNRGGCHKNPNNSDLCGTCWWAISYSSLVWACLHPEHDGALSGHVYTLNIRGLVYARNTACWLGHIFPEPYLDCHMFGHRSIASILWNGSIPLYPKQRWESPSPGHEWPGQLVLAFLHVCVAGICKGWNYLRRAD